MYWYWSSKDWSKSDISAEANSPLLDQTWMFILNVLYIRLMGPSRFAPQTDSIRVSQILALSESMIFPLCFSLAYFRYNRIFFVCFLIRLVDFKVIIYIVAYEMSLQVSYIWDMSSCSDASWHFYGLFNTKYRSSV